MTCSRRGAIALLTLPLAPAWAQTAEPRRTIVLAGSTTTYESALGPWLKLIYTEAFRRLGYDFEYRVYPTARASLLSDAGEVDGEFVRVFEYGAAHPNMIRVALPTVAGNLVAYARPGLPLADGWDSLKDTSLRVDYRLGAAVTHQALTGRVPPARLSAVPDVPTGLRKLKQGHADVFVDLDLHIEGVLQTPEFKGVDLRRAAFMQKVEGYCYLHKKNAALVAPLTDVLAAMLADGSIDKFRKQGLR